MVVANIFQGLQTFLLTRETLPDNLQVILDQQLPSRPSRWPPPPAAAMERLPFEPKGKK